MALAVPDTRPLFRPLYANVLTLFRSLEPSDWERPTVAPMWRVRDVVAHMLDTTLRRLSFQRDGVSPPSPPRPVASERDLVAVVNELNATWIRAAARLSPRVLVDLYAGATADLCAFIERLPDDVPPLFPVSWAGDRGSDGLLDIAREFTEIWHHGAQVRDAVDAGPFRDPRWLHAVIATALHALPHAYRDVEARSGDALVLDVGGAAGGTWTLRRLESGWDIFDGSDASPTSRATMTDDVAWRLLFNALGHRTDAVRLSGDLALARPLLRARSVIV